MICQHLNDKKNKSDRDFFSVANFSGLLFRFSPLKTLKILLCESRYTKNNTVGGQCRRCFSKTGINYILQNLLLYDRRIHLFGFDNGFIFRYEFVKEFFPVKPDRKIFEKKRRVSRHIDNSRFFVLEVHGHISVVEIPVDNLGLCAVLIKNLHCLARRLRAPVVPLHIGKNNYIIWKRSKRRKKFHHFS